jgi:hypothetical protein
MINRISLSLLVCLFLPGLLEACGCLPDCTSYFSHVKECVQDRIKGSSAVFKGKVVSVERQKDDEPIYKASFAVTDSWKGVSSNLIDVYYYDLAANGCPFSLNKGGLYTFFASISNGKLSINECDSGAGYEGYFPKGKHWKTRSK